ncbi:hypothetical protein J3D46_003848 [Paenarthrobacter sp. A20]|nr:hypothetical protein [Paenarthrobacter sp. A20]
MSSVSLRLVWKPAWAAGSALHDDVDGVVLRRKVVEP